MQKIQIRLTVATTISMILFNLSHPCCAQEIDDEPDRPRNENKNVYAESRCPQCEMEINGICVPTKNGTPCDGGFCCEGECLPDNPNKPKCPEGPDPLFKSAKELIGYERTGYLGYFTRRPHILRLSVFQAVEVEYTFKYTPCINSDPVCGKNPAPASITLNPGLHSFGGSLTIPNTPFSLGYSYSYSSISQTLPVFPEKDDVPKCERRWGSYNIQQSRRRLVFTASGVRENYIWHHGRPSSDPKNYLKQDTPFITPRPVPKPSPEFTDWSKFQDSDVRVGEIVSSICL